MAGSDQVNRNLRELMERKKAAIRALAERTTGEMEAYAKPNAPWADRTGDARESLFGYVLSRETTLLLRIAHGQEYGKWLELCNQGKYAILEPTTKRFAPMFFEDVRKLVGR